MKPKSLFYAGAVAALVGVQPATATSVVNTDAPGLASQQEPGSFLVWPKFVGGTVVVDAPGSSEMTLAATVIEVSAICPFGGLAPACGPDQPINVHFHWVCAPKNGGGICTETDFIRPITYGAGHSGTLTFNPSGIANPPGSNVNGNTGVPTANCVDGFLTAWAVDATDRPIKFDGLLGGARTRATTATGNSWDVAYYQATTIQADPQATELAVLDTTTGLHFDGGPLHYQMVTGQLQSPVRLDSQTNVPFHQSFLILLTLDIKEGLANTQTLVPIDFFNAAEVRESTSARFVCWGQFGLSGTDGQGLFLDSNLTVDALGTSFGTTKADDAAVMVTGQAMDASNPTNQRTLLGLVLDQESPFTTFNDPTRGFYRTPGNNSLPIPTTYVPLP